MLQYPTTRDMRYNPGLGALICCSAALIATRICYRATTRVELRADMLFSSAPGGHMLFNSAPGAYMPDYMLYALCSPGGRIQRTPQPHYPPERPLWVMLADQATAHGSRAFARVRRRCTEATRGSGKLFFWRSCHLSDASAMFIVWSC